MMALPLFARRLSLMRTRSAARSAPVRYAPAGRLSRDVIPAVFRSRHSTVFRKRR